MVPFKDLWSKLIAAWKTTSPHEVGPAKTKSRASWTLKLITGQPNGRWTAEDSITLIAFPCTVHPAPRAVAVQVPIKTLLAGGRCDTL
jgi:hypothetical protein